MISVITTIMYLKKIYVVLKWHKSDPETYRREAMPSVLHSKIWNSIQGVALFSSCLVFITNGGRVCAGWYLPSQRYNGFLQHEDGYSTYERDSYLLAREGWFVMAAVFGLCNIIGFVFFGYKSEN